MTVFEILVPVVALAVAGAGTLVIHLAYLKAQKDRQSQHPAE